MNLTELKTKLGDNFRQFFATLANVYSNGDKSEEYGVAFEIVRYEREDAYMELVVKIDESYFKTLGSYDSWVGTSWDYSDIEEVKPVEVVVIQYHKI